MANQQKWLRNYLLLVETQNGAILEIRPPFTLQFDIIRNTLTSANVCQLRIYNLSLTNRKQLLFNVSNYGQFRSVALFAGYGTNLPLIFSGNISRAWSVRESTNFITQIECYDGGFAFSNGDINIPFPANTAMTTVLSTIAGSLPHTTVGAIGSFPGSLTRGNTYSGSGLKILSELSGGAVFIDNGKVNILGTNEYIADQNDFLVVDASSGLLGTPLLEETIVHFDMLFEPSLQVGRRVQVNSRTESNFNGFYKCTAVKHRGMISEAVCGEAITTGEFFYTKILSGVSGVSP